MNFRRQCTAFLYAGHFYTDLTIWSFFFLGLLFLCKPPRRAVGIVDGGLLRDSFEVDVPEMWSVHLGRVPPGEFVGRLVKLEVISFALKETRGAEGSSLCSS